MKGSNMGDSTATTCTCGKPTRDAAYTCDDCATSLSRALGEVPWVSDELDTTITRQKAVTYNGGGGRGAEKPSPVHWGASQARTNLRATLVTWVRWCDEEQVRNASPHDGLPADNLTAMSRWLMWRVDGLALLDCGPEAVEQITSAVAHCHRVIDRPADRQFLGRCPDCESGHVYAPPGGKVARCEECDATTEADAIRARLLGELDDRLCTAAEIARLSTYLGLRANREQVRKRINQWHKRGVIRAGGGVLGGAPAFRFGIVWRLLQQDEAKESA